MENTVSLKRDTSNVKVNVQEKDREKREKRIKKQGLYK